MKTKSLPLHEKKISVRGQATLVSSKKVIMFDLDGTLTKSKSILDQEMASLLCRLLEEKIVAVMGGGNYPQFKNQFLKYLSCSAEQLKNLYILPVSGGSLYVYKASRWHLAYSNVLTSREKKEVLGAFKKAFHDIVYISPQKIYGEVLEDRESQITFSALGQKAPLEQKKEWNESFDVRPKLQKVLKKYLPDFEVRLGGLTSIDITKKGIDKAYGVKQIAKLLSIPKKDIVYIGDALYKGGNDYAVKRAKVDTLQIKDEEETKKIILSLLKKKAQKPELTKAGTNPIIRPLQRSEWQAWQTFNPGVILLEDKVHFLYRAIGADGISRFGYARSPDGLKIDERLPYPVFEHHLTPGSFSYWSFTSGGSFGGAEDPRIVRIGKESVLYVTYTACDGGLRVGLTSIKVEDFLAKKWNWKSPKLISPPGEVHKNWVIFPEKINGRYAILHSINPTISIEYRDDLDFNELDYIESHYGGVVRKNCWDSSVRGAGAPPIKTKYGWLLFYHAIDKRDSGRYKVGAMLLDQYDPTKILHRGVEPILEPDEWYENNGFKAGIVYVTGAVVKDGKLLVYYGGADSYVNFASVDLEEFLQNLIQTKKPKLKRVTRKK